MLKNFFKFGKKKKDEKQKETLENQIEKEIEDSQSEIDKIKAETEKEIKETAEEILGKNHKKAEYKEKNLKTEKIENEMEKIEETSNEKTKSKPKLKPLKDRLATPKKGFFGKLKEMLLGKTINDDLYEELEELLIQSDIGMNMTMQLVEELESSVSRKKLKTSEQIYDELKELLKAKLIYNDEENTKLKLKNGKLNILLVVGVNGVGKTTSIGKIAKKLKDSGKKVIIGAGDTFRAAAIEQVEEWGKRTGVEVVKQAHGSDPAAVIFDTVKTAKNRGFDVAILDTAGRLHNKRDLMKELEKINKIIREQSGETDFETLLVIDSTTGQNGLEQARIFNEIVDLTGIILTKFDGTAKGGIIFPITSELKKPIKFIGVGEGIEDLREFDKKEFVEAMFD
ncbi:signal recognition particle-docking protein FtsY [Leptotrichia buccalis]|uniref:Signal recognition particle receptor FtsY n=1 Tax=Leptotrichia buccalis (strain ATCC 14201 / DSM 1135 / JCM 12969 / NCTC 10249 / C-1013-b) TaxID=523794 RepID=C7NE49_LEPBD|nr:signal recognition particle-docking protein FtsY [Leptotrichia buccalis]ACV38244.1 signal recognition particle-docking protein FtsY [Leptotrichia buccalis C-1013-b]